MVAIITNLKFVLLFLITVNALLFFIFKTPYRFIKGPLILLTFLLITCLSYRILVYPAINKQVEQEKSVEIKKRGWEYLKVPDMDAAFQKRHQENNLMTATLFRIVGLQAVFALILAVIGIFISDTKKIYSLYALCFILIAIFLLK